jgi:hypothetical protein
MESDLTPQQALVDAERATAAVWIDYPPTPAWYYPASGAWHAGFVGALGALYDKPVLLAVAAGVLGGLVGWFLHWYTGYRGTYPKVSSAPEEFRSAIAAFLAAYTVLLVATVGLTVAVDPVVAAVVAFVGFTATVYVYERAYERAAAATRRRLEEQPA